MKTIKLTPSNQTKIINKSIEALTAGELIIYPTETCYGLGADATNQKAINKLLQFKTRREGKAFSVAVTNQQMAEQYVTLNQTAKNLYQNFLPGPLTIVSKIRRTEEQKNKKTKKQKLTSNVKGQLSNVKLAQGVTSEFHTLGIRIPNHDFILQLVKQFGKPITATSANVSYQSPPYSLAQWQKQTPVKSQPLIDLWIDAGKLPKRPPSTVIDTTIDELTVIRQGNIKIQSAIIKTTTNSEKETHQLAKQILNRYYQKNNSPLERGPRLCRGGVCLLIGLQGELGAGKTQFTKGIAQALGIKQNIKSPTFTLVHEYPIPHQITKSQNHQITKLKDLKSTKHQITKLPNFQTSTLFHIDTWRMETSQELLKIGIKDMLKPGNIIVIEWVEKVMNIVHRITRSPDHKITTLLGTINVLDSHTRKWKFSNAK